MRGKRVPIGSESPYQMRAIRGYEFESIVPWKEVIDDMQ